MKSILLIIIILLRNIILKLNLSLTFNLAIMMYRLLKCPSWSFLPRGCRVGSTHMSRAEGSPRSRGTALRRAWTPRDIHAAKNACVDTSVVCTSSTTHRSGLKVNCSKITGNLQNHRARGHPIKASVRW